MKRMIATALVLALGPLSVGCNNGTPGGTGNTTNQNRPGIAPAEGTFTISTPTFGTSIKQGEAKVVELSIHRGKNFQDSVTIKLEGLPKGVTADPAAPAIKAGEDTAKVTLTAAPEAALGDFTVNVIAHPTKGEDSTNHFKLTIDKK